MKRRTIKMEEASHADEALSPDEEMDSETGASTLKRSRVSETKIEHMVVTYVNRIIECAIAAAQADPRWAHSASGHCKYDAGKDTKSKK